MVAKRLKRCLAGVLAAVTMLSSSNVAYAANNTFANGEAVEGAQASVTDVDVIADYYGTLTEYEKAVLKHPLIAKETLVENVVAPTADDELITIQAESGNGRVLAKAFSNDDGNVQWMPVAATLEMGESKETLTLADVTEDESAEGYVKAADFTYTGVCTVYVDYQLKVEIEEQRQRNVLAIPGILADGIFKMEEIFDIDMQSQLSVINTFLPKIEESKEYFETENAKTALEALLNERTDNNELMLQFYASAYHEADNSLQYALDNGAKIKDYVDSTYKSLKAIYDDSTVQEALESNADAKENFEALISEGGEDTEPGSLYALNGADWLFLDNGNLELVFGNAENVNVDDVLAAAVKGIVDDGLTSMPEVSAESFVIGSVQLNESIDASTVKFIAKVLDGKNNTVFSNETESIFADGVITDADAAKMQELIASAENATLNAWKATLAEQGFSDDEIKKVIEDKYTKTVSYEELPSEVVAGGFTYEITYTPNKYTVTIDESETEYAYGTKIPLGNADDAEKYDYLVTGADSGSRYYDHGAEITVTEDLTIEKALASPKEEFTVYELLSKDPNYDFTDGDRAILESDALVSETVKIRYPQPMAAGNITPSKDGKTYSLTVSEYSSGVTGMVWVPAAVYLMNDETVVANLKEAAPQTASLLPEGETGKTETFTWENSANKKFTHVNVTYKLEITHISTDNGYRELVDTDYTSAFGLPAELKNAVETQQDLLIGEGVSAKSVYDSMATKKEDGTEECFVNASLLDILATQLTDKGKAAVTAIRTKETFDESGNALGGWNYAANELSIFSYLRRASNGDTWSLANYFINEYHEGIRKQAKFLKPHLQTIIADEGFDKFLEQAVAQGLLSQEDADKYKSKLDDLESDLAIFDDAAGLGVYPVDTKADGFAKLVDETVLAAEVGEEALAAKGLYAYKTIRVNAPTVVSATINVKVDNKTIATADVPIASLEEGKTEYTVTADDVAKIVNIVNELAKAYSDEKYYTKSALEFDAGDVISGNVQLTVNYTSIPYTVTLKGETIATLYYGKGYGITLPACSTDAEDPIYYKYTVEEKVYPVDNGTNGYYEFADLTGFKNNTCEITRVTYDRNTEEIDKFVDMMNSEFASNNVTEIQLVKAKSESEHENGKYDSITLKIAASAELEMNDVITAIGNAFQKMNYDYIGFGELDENGNSQTMFKYLDETGAIKLNPQALLDMFLNGGITSDSLIKAIDENGNLIETSIHLGDSKTANEFENIPLYVKLEDNESGYLEQLRTYVSSLKRNGFTLDMSQGKVYISGVLDEQLYNTYLSLMILLDNGITLEDFNDNIDIQKQLRAIMDMLEPVLESEEYNWETVKNTLVKLGFKGNLDGSKDVIQKVVELTKDLYNKLNKESDDAIFEESGDNWFAFNVVYDTEGMLSEVDGFDIIADMIAETKLTIPCKFELINIKEAYEALVVDMGQSGLAKINYTDDLAATLANAKGTAYVVLLGNVENTGDISLSKSAIINLNGYQILCDINAGTQSLKIVNTVADSKNAGVFGNITGEDVTLTSGYYTSETINAVGLKNAYIASEEVDGYVQVQNKYYTLNEVENDKGGYDWTVVLTPEFASMLEKDVKDLVVEMAADVLFRVYANASVSLNEYNIYEFGFENLLDYINHAGAAVSDAVEAFDEDGIEWILNDLFARFTDFDALAETLGDTESSLEVVSYVMTTKPWTASPYIGEGNTIAVEVAPGDATENNLTFKFADKNENLAASFAEMDKIVTIDKEIILDEISYSNGFEIKGTAGLDVVIDMLYKGGDNKDYATTLAVILAYNMEDGADRDAFITAIENYVSNVYSGDLKAKIDALTLGDVKAAIEKAFTVEEFATILNALNLTDTEIGNYSTELAKCYKPLVDAFREIEKEVDAVAGDKFDEHFAAHSTKPLKSIKNADENYEVEISNSTDKIWVNVELKLFYEESESDENVEAFLNAMDALEEYPENAEIEEIKAAAVNASENIAKALDAYENMTDEQKTLFARNYEELTDLINAYEQALGVWATDIAEQFYVGEAIEPEVTVYCGAVLLTEGEDYTVKYKNNVEVASAADEKAPTVTVKVDYEDYDNEIILEFTISRGKLAEAIAKDILYKDAKYNYRTVVNVKNTIGKLLENKVDYNVYYQVQEDGKFIGLADSKYYDSTTMKITIPTSQSELILRAKIVGRGNYVGTTYAEFSVEKQDLNKCDISVSDIAYKDAKYNYRTTVKVVDIEGNLLENKKDYLVYYQIKENGDWISLNKSEIYNSSKARIELTISDPVAEMRVKIVGAGDYTGSVVYKPFTITRGTINTGTVTAENVVYEDARYNYRTIVNVKDSNGKILENKTDYLVYYQIKENGKWISLNKSEIFNSSKARIKLTAANPVTEMRVQVVGTGDYAGNATVYKTFTIIHGTITASTVVAENRAYEEVKYNYRTVIKVTDTNGKTLKNQTDYLVYYQIKENGKWITVSKGEVYNTDKKALELTVSNPVAEMRAKIVGKGDYAGNATVYKTFKITHGTIKANTVIAENRAYEEAKYNYRTVIKVTDTNGKTLKNQTDYFVYYQIKENGKWITVSKGEVYNTNKKALELTVSNPVAEMRAKIVGTGDYAGNATVYKTFTITRGTIKSNTVTAKNIAYEDAKYNYRTVIKVKDSNGKLLKNKTDYNVYYQVKEDEKWVTLSKSAIYNNLRITLTASNPVAEMRAKIVGTGDYAGNATVYKPFTITHGTIKSTTVTAKNIAYKDAKYNYRTVIKVKDSNGKLLENKTDYNVYYQVKEDGKWVTLSKSAIYNNLRITLTASNPVAEMRAKIVGTGDYAGNPTVYKTFTISR